MSSGLNIGAVERDTGLSKDTLRMWERRYAFPNPTRDRHGERVYSAAQVEKLCLIRRLVECGHRPGKIIGQSIERLRALGTDASKGLADPEGLDIFLKLIRSHQLQELRSQFSQTIARRGLQNFILETVAPLNIAVGNAWMGGRLAIFEEHLYSEMIQNVLRNAIASIQPRERSPRVLLTSLPQEQHSIGLLMAEAMLMVEGAACIPLGPQTPLADIVTAAQVHQAEVVALSFSSSYPEIKAAEGLKQLRGALSLATRLWAGGAGALRLRNPIEGVELVESFQKMADMVNQWRDPDSVE
jgi:DNA-binding transcriptional MerR regulator